METFHPDMSTYVKSCTRTRPRKSKGAESYRGQSSVVLVVVVILLRGQSAFFLVVAVSLRGQSFFVDGVYIL